MNKFKRYIVALCLAVTGVLNCTGALATETVTFFHNDIAGTPMLATDSAGNVVWKENYRPYGERLNKSNAAENNQLWFAGKPQDAHTGLSYMGARYYDPVLGRFMSVDPVGFDPENLHSFNRYAYANNNPYKFVDPDGHSPIDVAFLAYDLGKLGAAFYSGVGIGMALADVAKSSVGVVSPVPGVGQALKAARMADHVVDAAKVAENGVGATKEVATFSQIRIALTSAQESYKGSTVVGHALSKHAGREPEVWGRMTGAMHTWNDQGMAHFREIARGSGEFGQVTHKGINFVEKRLEDGRGARFNMNGTFKGFVDWRSW